MAMCHNHLVNVDYGQNLIALAVLLQVYQLSIGAACGLSWPADRIIIQVLDDSTDPIIKVS